MNRSTSSKASTNSSWVARRFMPPAGTFLFGPRGVAHSFKNVGTTPARILIVAQPAGVEKFLEEISELASAGAPGLDKVIALAARYGIEILV
jgi:hypothetical protein